MGQGVPRAEDAGKRQEDLSLDDQKRMAGEAATELVQDGMIVGLGSGSTAAWFVRALAARRLDIRGVATSLETQRLAVDLGLTLIGFDSIGGLLDLTVDGADEIGPALALIKGAGGALLREKLVWTASRRCVVIADASKPAEQLGAVPLPIEVVRFGHAATVRRMAAELDRLGFQARIEIRGGPDAPFLTDGGNLIYDAACGPIADPAALASALKLVTGVVEHGLFLGYAERALIATPKGVQTLWP